MRLPGHFSSLRSHVDTFIANCHSGWKNVFVIMRYRQAGQYAEIESVIRHTLQRSGLSVHLAKDRTFVPNDMWTNLCVYMCACDFGIAVFEEIDTREFNPNIAIEVGFMLALGKPVLLLKDSRMPSLPTDFCGHLYKDFDTYAIPSTVASRIKEWLDDLRARGVL